MIPEFPLPPAEADFYHSKLYERPPLFGVYTPFEVPQYSLAKMDKIKLDIDLQRSLKTAAVRARFYSSQRPKSSISDSPMTTVVRNVLSPVRQIFAFS